MPSSPGPHLATAAPTPPARRVAGSVPRHPLPHLPGVDARGASSRRVGLGVLASGVICPCHALAWLAGLLLGAPLLGPAAQDGLHAVYVPLAVLVGTCLLRPRTQQHASSVAVIPAAPPTAAPVELPVEPAPRTLSRA